MELQGQDGSKLLLNTDSDTVFGRGLGFNTKDNTVSRRHVIFNSKEDPETATFSRVSFQVTGKNPIWVRRGGGETIEVFRSSESGEVADGDWLCVSSQNPVWFCLKSLNLESFDVSKIDPVKEFGFWVIGHEFDGYKKQKIGRMENWNWFLEVDSRSDDDEEGGGEKKRRKRKKTGRGGNEEDDKDWSGESEEDKEVVSKKVVGVRPKYLTRSKEASKVRKDVKRKKNAPKQEVDEEEEEDEEEEDEEEEDETLGGFIVGDENEIDEEELDECEEQEGEEEFVDDEDDDDL